MGVLVRHPYRLLFPAIILFCRIGAYASTNSVFSVWLMLGWGALGVLVNKVGVEPHPWSWVSFWDRFWRKISAGPCSVRWRSDGLHPASDQRDAPAVAAILLVVLIFPTIRRKREVALQE